MPARIILSIKTRFLKNKKISEKLFLKDLFLKPQKNTFNLSGTNPFVCWVRLSKFGIGIFIGKILH